MTRFSSKSRVGFTRFRWGLTLGVAVAVSAVGAVIGTGAAAIASQSLPTPHSERIDQSVEVIAGDAHMGVWHGTVVVSRHSRVVQSVRRTGPWQLSMTVERTQCDAVGCLRTVLSTPDQAGVSMSVRLAAGLAGARVHKGVLPVIVERFDGADLISRHMTVMELALSASTIGSVSTDSAIRIEGGLHRMTRHRTARVDGIVALTPMAGISQTSEPIQLVGSQGRISVVREMVTHIPKR